MRKRIGIIGALVAILAAMAFLLAPAVRRLWHVEAPAVATADAMQLPDRPEDGSLRLAQVGAVSTYRPTGGIRGVALFLSDASGWNEAAAAMAHKLEHEGIAVAGISTPQFLKALERSRDKCINPNPALTATAQNFEHQLGLAKYRKPILMGQGEGGTMAYGALAQVSPGIYRAVLSLNIAPQIDGTKPWCAAPGRPAKAPRPVAPDLHRPPTGDVPSPWMLLQGQDRPATDVALIRRFIAPMTQAQLVEVADIGHGRIMPGHWMPSLDAALAPYLDKPVPVAPSTRIDATSVSDLPLNLVTDDTAPHGDMMAVLYSGDGGWAGLDREIAARLAARGVPVVGIDSLDYFWSARTPRGAGNDLGRIITHFSQQWQRPRVLLIGYSFGADDLPFIVGAMPPALRPSIARVSLLGLSPSADFQFHLASWIDVDGANALPTVPQILRLRGLPLQCIRGEAETNSACPAIPARVAVPVLLPGNHYFNHNGDLIASTMLEGIRT